MTIKPEREREGERVGQWGFKCFYEFLCQGGERK